MAMTNDTMFAEKELFGGAMSCLVPTMGNWVDASNFRQIPDNQECFVEGGPHSLDPALLVVEIVEQPSGVTDDDAARSFWDNLCEDNRSRASTFAPRRPPPPACATTRSTAPLLLISDHVTACCVGYQKIAMGRDYDVDGNDRSDQQEIKWVKVYLAVLRLPEKTTDILVTLSKPVPGSDPNLDQLPPPPIQDGADGKLFKVWGAAVGSLKVNDWNLFG